MKSLGLWREEVSDIDKALNEVAEVIPSAYQFPELVCASISYSGKTFETKNFKKTAWRQSAIIEVSGKEVGIVEVFYLQEIPFLIEEGKMINEAASLIGNITERKKAEAEIEAEKEKLETYIESMVDGVVVTDAKGVIVQANKSYAEILGY
ncbi:PAS domain S-box protein, partial [Candidatus Pacearchaeota archaeon]|nr:PAS domain S-box protein [Candidatus Pacearchaeota archaeon]